MPVSLQSALLTSRSAAVRVVKRAFWVTLVACCACIPLVQAQSGTPAQLPSAPDAPSTQARTSVPAISQTPTARPFWQWSQSTLYPLQPSLAIGSDSGVSFGSFAANSPRGFNSGHMGQAGFNPMGGKDSGRWQGGASMHDSANILGQASPSPLSLNQFMRSNWNTPLNASADKPRSSFQAPFAFGTNLGDLTHPLTNGLYTTTDLGNGMFLSAGTYFGHSNVGAPAAGMGSNASGAKRPGPSLGVKLSF